MFEQQLIRDLLTHVGYQSDYTPRYFVRADSMPDSALKVARLFEHEWRTPFAGLVGPLRSPMSGSDCLIVETNWVFNGIAVAITVHESGQWGWATLDGENDKRLVQESPIPLDHYATLGELLAVLAVAFERRNAP